jgi:acetyl esterase
MDKLAQIRSQCSVISVDKSYLKRYFLAETKDIYIPSKHGKVLVYLYRPFSEGSSLPVVVNFHGAHSSKDIEARILSFPI